MDENNRNHNITDIEISEKRKEFTNLENNRKTYKRKNKKIWQKIVAFIIFALIFFFAISYFLHSAKVEVQPNIEKLTFTKKDIYKAIPKEKNNTDIKVKQQEDNKINKVSIGEITIINKTKQRQNLRKETRFQTEDGLIFKTFSPVILKANSKITVKAFSDKTGEKYNVKKGLKLTIPGFKEAKMDSEFKNITGEIAKNFTYSDKVIKNSTVSQKASKIEGVIQYSILKTELEQSKKIDSIGVDTIDKKSEGEIEISNNLSKTQKLRKETRFQTEDGFIFKTFKSVTIPAKSKVIAKVFSDKTGEKYNVKKGLKLTIPGFKEAKMDSEFKNITAVTKTDISGSVSGKTNIPNKEQLEKAKKELKTEILDELTIETKKQKKNTDIILGDNFNTKYKFTTESVTDGVLVKVKAIQEVPIISKKDFKEMIFKTDDKKEQNVNNIEIKNYSKLTFEIKDQDNSLINLNSSFKFNVTGDILASRVINIGELKDQIAGKDKKKAIEILKNNYYYENFQFNILIAPFWRSSLPSDKEDIDIIIK